MPDFRQLADDFWVAPQIALSDLAEAKAMGIKTVIGNRPDGEQADQPSAEIVRAAAEAEGLAFVHVPVVTGKMTMADVDAFGTAVAGHEGPYLAFCRSGTRSTHLWSLNAARHESPNAIVEAAAKAGYDIEGLRPLLVERHAETVAKG